MIILPPGCGAASPQEFVYTCCACGHQWHGRRPTFEDGRMMVVSAVYCSGPCALAGLAGAGPPMQA